MKLITISTTLLFFVALGRVSHAGLMFDITQNGTISGGASVDCSIEGNGPIVNSRALRIDFDTGQDDVTAIGPLQNNQCSGVAIAQANIAQRGSQPFDDFSFDLSMGINGAGGATSEEVSANVIMNPMLFEVTTTQNIRINVSAAIGWETSGIGFANVRAIFALSSINPNSMPFFSSFLFERETSATGETFFEDIDEVLTLGPGIYKVGASLNGLSVGETDSNFFGIMNARIVEATSPTTATLFCFALVGFWLVRRK